MNDEIRSAPLDNVFLVEYTIEGKMAVKDAKHRTEAKQIVKKKMLNILNLRGLAKTYKLKITKAIPYKDIKK